MNAEQKQEDITYKQDVLIGWLSSGIGSLVLTVCAQSDATSDIR